MNMLLYQMAITVSLAERRVVDGVPHLLILEHGKKGSGCVSLEQ